MVCLYASRVGFFSVLFTLLPIRLNEKTKNQTEFSWVVFSVISHKFFLFLFDEHSVNAFGAFFSAMPSNKCVKRACRGRWEREKSVKHSIDKFYNREISFEIAFIKEEWSERLRKKLWMENSTNVTCLYCH